MIVNRKPLTFWERLYLPAILGGLKVTLRHAFRTLFQGKKVTMEYPPPKAIKIIPPGPAGRLADRSNAEKMPQEFEINMLRCIFCGFCQEVCPEEAIFLQKDYSLTGLTRAEMIYDKEKLLALGGTVGGVQKWKHKLEEAKEQETFPVKV
jgi:NADH-quinone oxidoreductase subunit I